MHIALDPAHPSHVLPPAPGSGQRVLDIGCGAGQTLIGAGGSAALAIGVDIDIAALQLGRTWTAERRQPVAFACAAAEALPFSAGIFDLVWARVSLAYTDLHRSLPEIRRVLKPGGSAWLVLHSATVPWHSARSGGWRQWLFFGYIVANSWLFHFAGRNLPFRRNRYESFQTAGGMRRALKACGFANIQIEHKPHFVVVAR